MVACVDYFPVHTSMGEVLISAELQLIFIGEHIFIKVSVNSIFDYDITHHQTYWWTQSIFKSLWLHHLWKRTICRSEMTQIRYETHEQRCVCCVSIFHWLFYSCTTKITPVMLLPPHIFKWNKPKWLTVAMPLLETSERLERDKREIRERQERETRERDKRERQERETRERETRERETRERQERDKRETRERLERD